MIMTTGSRSTIRGPLKLAFAAVSALALTLSAGTGTADTPKKGGELVVAIETDVRGFDSVEGGVLGLTGETVMRPIMEPLLFWNRETNQPEPHLATEWEASEDQLVWTVKLREGVKFHDGSDFGAEDVAHHYNRILDPANKSRSRFFIASIKEVVVVDPLTAEFHLHHPWQALLPFLATTSMSGPIPSKDAVEAGTQNRHPIGTGPFRFVEWASGDRLVVEKFDDYWAADEINLDKITFRILPDEPTRHASLKSGEVDISWTDRGSTIVDAQKDSSLTSHAASGAGGDIVLLNGKREPLNHPLLRQALSHAYNQEALAQVIWQNTRPVVTHPLGNLRDCGPSGYREFSVDKAKALVAQYLEETGQSEVPNIVMIHTTTARGRELGQIYQQTAKAAGIPLELQPVDQSTLVKRVFTNDFDISGWRIGDGADIGPQLFALTRSGSSYNLSGFNDPELDALGDSMRTALTMDDRLEKQCQMAEKINQDGGMLYFGGGRYYAFTGTDIKDLPKPFRGVLDVTRVWIDR